MKKYAKIVNEETKEVSVGTGTNSAFYQSIGMTEMEVEQAYNGQWYVLGFAPVKPEPTKEEIQALRSEAYRNEVDPITCHIQRLGDEEQTPELIAEIANLVAERKAKVAEIKARYPYPAEPIEASEEPLVELYSMEI
jgi:hypothetical protein